jgi:hypothetical protein
MRFNDAADVRKYIGGIFREAFEDDEIGPKLRETGIVLQFRTRQSGTYARPGWLTSCPGSPAARTPAPAGTTGWARSAWAWAWALTWCTPVRRWPVRCGRRADPAARKEGRRPGGHAPVVVDPDR